MNEQNPLNLFSHTQAVQVPGLLAHLARLRDSQITRDVSSRLCPNRPPRVEGLDLYGVSWPAQEAGGDFYEFVPLDPCGMALSVGDVCGNGAAAGILMSGLQSLLRALTRHGNREIGNVVRELNRAVWQISTDSFYATLFYAYLDPVLGELQYVNAGHESPLLIRRRTRRVHRLESTGTVLGLSDRIVHGQRTLHLDAGDLLVAYTDGVSEASNADGLMFGESGILQTVDRYSDASAGDLAVEILKAVDRHTGKRPQLEDRTVVVARYKGSVAETEPEEEMALAAA